MEIVFPKLETWQTDVWKHFDNPQDAMGKVFVVKARRQCGKTVLATLILIKYALQGKCTSIVIEPTLNQSRRVFKQIYTSLQGSGAIKNANASLLTIDFVNGSEILFKSAEQEDSLRGMTATGILVIDEGAFIKDDIYDILFPCVDANQAPVLIISTPLFTDGRFYQLYSSDDTVSFNWSEYDTSKYLPDEKLEMYRKQFSKGKFTSEYLGEFITDGSYVFGDIRHCIRESIKQPVYGGIDWASGSGGDSTVLTLMDEDMCVTDIFAWDKTEPTEQVSLISSIINQNKSLKKVTVELNSIGKVYYDMLKRQVKPQLLDGFTTTNDSKRRVIENLVKAFAEGTIGILDDRELISQLQHYAMEKTAKGYTYNAVGGFHDDYCISLALAYDSNSNTKGNYTVTLKKKKHAISLAEKYG